MLAATGAEKGSDCVKVDLSAEDEDIGVPGAFAEELAAKRLGPNDKEAGSMITASIYIQNKEETHGSDS